jgi:hypothetical protein
MLSDVHIWLLRNVDVFSGLSSFGLVELCIEWITRYDKIKIVLRIDLIDACPSFYRPYSNQTPFKQLRLVYCVTAVLNVLFRWFKTTVLSYQLLYVSVLRDL